MVAKRSSYPGYDDALAYLVDQGVQVRPGRGSDRPSESYVKRAYGVTKKYSEYGVTPSRAKLRGHDPTVILYLSRSKGRVAQYRTGDAEKPVERIDVVDLLNKADPITGPDIYSRKAGEVVGSFTGSVVYRDPLTGKVEFKYKTLAFVAEVGSLIQDLKDSSDMAEFAQYVSGYEWASVTSMNIVQA